MSAESVTSSESTLPGPDAGSLYTPHRPEQTLLHRTIREQIESFLARSGERGHRVPRFVEILVISTWVAILPTERIPPLVNLTKREGDYPSVVSRSGLRACARLRRTL
jgi:hypothetical protein